MTYILDEADSATMETGTAYLEPVLPQVLGPGHPDETDPAWIERLIKQPYNEGRRDRYICIDDAYKVKMGDEWFVRVAVASFEKGEDIRPYLYGDQDAFKRKMEDGSLRQIDMIIDSWEPTEDYFVGTMTQRAIEELADGERVDVYACNFFRDYLETGHPNYTFASGHRRNRHQRFVKLADAASKWMDKDEPVIVDYVNAVRDHWEENPQLKGEESFTFGKREVLVSPEVQKRYDGPFHKLRSLSKAA